MLIINGPPGVGKSTVARSLASGYEKAAHIEADTVQHMIISGLIWPDQEPREEGARQLLLRDANMIALANNYYSYGFIPILDVIIADHSEYKRYFDGLIVEPTLITLSALSDIIKRRDSDREKVLGNRWQDLNNRIWDFSAQHGHVLDTSNSTVNEVVANIQDIIDAI